MQSLDISLRFKINIVDFYCPFQYLLEYRSNDYIELNPDSYIPGTTVYCPFHPNTQTKSAKLYNKDTSAKVPTEKLYCFSENKLYYPHSLLSPPKSGEYAGMFKSIIPYDPDWVFSAIWQRLPEEDKIYWKNINPDIVISDSQHSFDNIYNDYRKSKVDLFYILDEIGKNTRVQK